MGCIRLSAGFSPLCSAHRNHRDRHGHPEQRPIKVGQLAPYLKLVTVRRARNPDSAAWRMLDQWWHGMVEQAIGRLRRYEDGRPDNKHALQAAQQVRNLTGSTSSVRVIDTALAMFMLRMAEPRLFRSDQAFTHQLVRRVRALGEVNVGSYWNHRCGRVKRTYKTLPPRTVAILAQQFTAAFGSAGVQLAELELGKEDREAAARQRLAEAIEAMQ